MHLMVDGTSEPATIRVAARRRALRREGQEFGLNTHGKKSAADDGNPDEHVGSVFRSISTLSVPPQRRLDFWRALHPNIEIDAVEKDARGNFRGDLLHYAAPDGSSFGITSCDDAVSRLDGAGQEFVLFSLTISGSVRVLRAGVRLRDVNAGEGLVALDSAWPLTTRTRRHKHLYLTIPRAKVVKALGDVSAPLSGGFANLPSVGMPQLLKSHLLTLAREGPRLNAQAAAAAVTCGVELALGALQELHGTSRWHGECPAEALHAAAHRYIQFHLGESTLTSARVARAVGCSRTQLHRVFVERGERVGEAIRLARLQAARALLTSATRLSIEQVAYSCGFDNASSFSRAFREFAGTSPSAFRKTRTK